MVEIIIEGIYQFIRDNNVRKDDVKIYLHPIEKRHIELEMYEMYKTYSVRPDNSISIDGIKIITGYDLKKIVIASPSFYNIKPLIINL